MTERGALARAKKAALGRVPLFQLSKEAEEAKDALFSALNEDLERLQNLLDRQSQTYQREDPHSVGAWLEELGNLADALDLVESAAPKQWEAVSAALEQEEESV